jgi:16S rRNA (uracil1498-N3)-methyltransferase
MNRFFLPENQIKDQQVEFPPDIAHQILHVLRLGERDGIEVLDNSGRVYQVRLRIDAGEDRILGEIVGTEIEHTEPKVGLTLYFGMTSRDKVEWILQKGTEIGVSAFFPFVSSRTLVQSTDLSEKKTNRWKRIIREAAEQSRRGRLPVLHHPLALASCISQGELKHDLYLIAWEETGQESESIRQLLEGFKGSSIALFIGPEGGFSEDEVQKARDAGCQVVSLGPRILRMETAAIVFPAIVLHELE